MKIFSKKKLKKLLLDIAMEAHMQGRIYSEMGEPENPPEVIKKLENYIDKKI